VFDQATLAPLSGNVALDLAAYVLAGMYMARITGDILDHFKSIRARQDRADQARLRLVERSAAVSSLQEELVGARGQAQKVVGEYLQDVDNRGRVSAAAQERERDPKFSELEDQLEKAASKSHHLSNR
jgi:vacuolar-type H+-ATPase subunit I/STV1